MARRISSPVFVGRRPELGQLEEAFGRAASGDPSLVLVAGEAGVGKSRLVAELARRVDLAGGWTLSGGCLEVGDGGLPYAPIAEALRTMARELDADARRIVLDPGVGELAWLVPELGGPPGTGAGPSPGAGRQARLLNSVLSTLGRAADRQPLVLVLEDLHWADGSTMDLLRFTVRNLRHERLLLVGTYRSDDLHRRHPLRPILSELERSSRVERLEIPRFDRPELAEQLEGILGEIPPRTLVDRLLTRSDGLPFYVEELIAGGEASASMPATLHDILDQRLTALSDSALALVRSASVIGGRFGHERLAAAVDMPDPTFMAALHETIESRIVLPLDDDGAGPAYVFRHALLREAAFDQLLPTERVRLHARLADHLKQKLDGSSSDDPSLIADLAIHSYHAHDQPTALESSVRAVRALVAATAYAEAFGHAERALELWPRVADAPERAGIDHPGLLALAARIAAATRLPDRAVAFSTAALGELEGSGDGLRQAALNTELHMFAWEAQDLHTFAAAAERAGELVAGSPPSSLKANALMVLASSRWWDDRMVESSRLFEEARAIAREVGDDQAWAAATAGLAHTLADAGEAERAADLVDQAALVEARFDDRPDALWAAIDATVALWTAGRFDDAQRTASNGLDQAIRYGWGARVGDLLRSLIVDCLFELGRYDLLLGRGVRAEGPVEQQVVDDLQAAGQEEGHGRQ